MHCPSLSTLHAPSRATTFSALTWPMPTCRSSRTQREARAAPARRQHRVGCTPSHAAVSSGDEQLEPEIDQPVHWRRRQLVGNSSRVFNRMDASGRRTRMPTDASSTQRQKAQTRTASTVSSTIRPATSGTLRLPVRPAIAMSTTVVDGDDRRSPYPLHAIALSRPNGTRRQALAVDVRIDGAAIRPD